jgi:hypothetical protein
MPAVNHLELNFDLDSAGIQPLIIIQRWNAGGEPVQEQTGGQVPCLQHLAGVE